MPAPELNERPPQSTSCHTERLITMTKQIEEREEEENDREQRMSVSGDDGEGEEQNIVVEEEEESSRGLRDGSERPGEETEEDVEGEIAHEEGREEVSGTASISVSI